MLLLEVFSQLEDFRRPQGRCYQIEHILCFSVLAILSGADSYRKIHTFIKKRLKRLKKLFNLKWKKAPAYTTIRNIIQGVSSLDLEAAFRKHAGTLSSDTTERGRLELSFDGKVIRGSFDHFKDQNAIQILSVFCGNNNLILAHEEIECKTNEIPVAQKIIPNLNVKNAVFTCDAINCQTKTLDIVKKTGNDIIVQVKNNQKNLLDDCVKTAETTMPVDEDREPLEKEHGRIVSRTAKVFLPEGLREKEKWAPVESIIQIERNRKDFNTKNKLWEDNGETSYYISTEVFSGKESNSIIRGHWGIENKNHNVKDTTMKEDFSRIRINPQNMVRLRSFALNTMRYNKVSNINRELYSNALDFKSLLKYKGL